MVRITSTQRVVAPLQHLVSIAESKRSVSSDCVRIVVYVEAKVRDSVGEPIIMIQKVVVISIDMVRITLYVLIIPDLAELVNVDLMRVGII